jgi:hypothetical protein
MAVAGGAFGVMLVAMAAAPSVAVAFVLAVPLGVASTAFMTGSNAILQLRAAPEMQGRVIALAVVVTNGAVPFGGPVVGALSDAWGPRAAFVVTGATALLTGIGGAVVAATRRPPVL